VTTVLLTGFRPFGGEVTNPSWQAVVLAASKWTRPEQLAIAELPVDFVAVDGVLHAAIEASQPDLVLCVGQAGGIRGLQLERVAINLQDARIPDNAGYQPIDVPVIADAAAAHFTTLPIKRGLAALTAEGVPVAISQSAGTFVCNHVFYRLMGVLPPGARGGFVHVPFAPGQFGAAGLPTMEVEAVADALVVLLETYLDHPDDVSLAGGSLF
jgi:pyroglutamyl-peptidase